MWCSTMKLYLGFYFTIEYIILALHSTHVSHHHTCVWWQILLVLWVLVNYLRCTTTITCVRKLRGRTVHTYVALYSCLKVYYLRFSTNYTCVSFILTFYSFALCLLLVLNFTCAHLTCVRSTYVTRAHLARTYVFHTRTPDKYDQNTSRNFIPCDATCY